MEILNERLIKEFIFKFLRENTKSHIYREGVKLSCSGDISSQKVLTNETDKFKIETVFQDNIRNIAIVNFKKFEIFSECTCCIESCKHTVASLIYFISNYSFDYYNIYQNSISPAELISVKEIPEKITGVVFLENDIVPALIYFKNNRYFLKSFLEHEKIYEIIDKKIVDDELLFNEFLISTTRPIFFVKKSKRTVSKVFLGKKAKIFLNIEKLNDNFVKISAEFEDNENVFKLINGIEKIAVLYKSGELRLLPKDVKLDILDKFLTGYQVITVEMLNELICYEEILNNYNIFFNREKVVLFQVENVEPEVSVYLDTEDNFLKIDILLKYGNHEVNILGKRRIFKDIIIFKSDTEKFILKTLKDANAVIKSESFYLAENDALNFLINILPDAFQNFNILGEEKLTRFRIRYPSVSSGIKIFSAKEWFDIEGEFDFGEKKISLNELIKNIKENKKYVKISKNSYGVIPEYLFQRIKRLITDKDFKLDHHHRKIKIFKLNALDKEKFLKDFINGDQAVNEIVSIKKRLTNFVKIGQVKIPDKYNKILRDYQKHGVKWLFFLKENFLNGILADDMGLGKTIQALTFLSMLRSNKPSLIIVPTSLLYNWENEIKKFSYDFSYLIYYGKEREKVIPNVGKYKLILTTYNIVRIDIDKLKKFEFHYIILDESQYIKNPSSIISRFIKKLKSEHRLSLTGTPFENSITDIWSQFDFLHPGLLGNVHEFKKGFNKNVEKLRKKLSPLILRRNKSDVLKELPPKTEINYFYEMNPEQWEFYNSVKAFYLEKIISSIHNKGLKKSKLLIIEGLLRLRQICCHPKLVKFQHIKYKNMKSEKFENLKKIMNELIKKDSKIVIYSQFVQMLKIIRTWIKAHGIRYEYIDGGTQKRFEKIINFQNNPDIKIFLVSLKAGGLGINLTAADNVIIYDPWWNPATENQAIDRIYRIGQDKKVFVYRLLLKNSVEEKILQLQEKKREMFDMLIESDSAVKDLTIEDIKYIFS